MKVETILNYRNFLWLWFHLLLLVVAIILYLLHDPIGGPSGDTWLGYTYGIIAAAGMCILMWYGIRKRSYHSTNTTLKGSLAVHVWLGLSMLILVPLHSGFSFGLNVHTLAYALMVVTILTGIWGAVNYFSLAPEIGSHRGQGSLKELLDQFNAIESHLVTCKEGKSGDFMNMADRYDFLFKPGLLKILATSRLIPPPAKDTATLIADLPVAEKNEAVKFVGLLNKKFSLANSIMDEVKVNFWLRLWLYLHVPFAIAAFVAMFIHIFVVFYYG